ncbi:MAG: FlgD immunoglobulin-like domain containing protein [Candidatus Eisenbacteria bacterium]
MKRLALTITAFTAALIGAALLFAPGDSRRSLTTDEVAREIRAMKSESRAAREEAGLPVGPGAEPNDWAYRQRAYPFGRLNFEELTVAGAEARAMRGAAKASSLSWTERGPSNIGGRVTDLEVHPANPSILYAAMASGGVFRSADAGVSWTPIFDEQAALTIGDIAIDPENPDVVWVGTGEANSSSFSWFGIGVYRSDDAGATWSYAGLEETRYIGRVVVDPGNPDRVWVAGAGVLFGTNPERGVYRTLNGGSTWDRVLFVNDSTSAVDIAIDPAKPDTVFAAMWERVRGLTYRRSRGPGSGLYRSHDGGDTWMKLTGGLPTGDKVGRIGVSVCAGSPNVVYAIYDMENTSGSLECRVYKSTNGGNTWARTSDGALSGIYSTFGWYFGQVRVDPTNSNRVFALGVPFYRTENGGSSWSQVGSSNHVDHHALVFDPVTPTRIWEGNDGGIYVSENQGDSWTKLYDQPTNQFYKIEIDNLQPQRIYGGTQDNGTLRTLTGATDDWTNIFGGDGFTTLVHPANSNMIWAGYQYGNYYESTDLGSSWDWALSGVSSADRRNWSSPLVFDPSDPETMYYGTYRVWRSVNGSASWTSISPDLTGGDHGSGFGTVTTIAVSPADPDVIWAGTDDSNVWVTQNGGSTWSNVSASLPNRWVTCVEPDPANPSVAYVTFSGLRWDQEISHVYRTGNLGSTWSDISANLPESPTNVILVDPGAPSTLYLGSDVGCFYSTDTGASWSVLGAGLPAVPVWDLDFHEPTRTLVAGTHGRSAHSIDLSVSTAVEEGIPSARTGARLENAPNPFNPSTTVTYRLGEASDVTLSVYDLAGRRVRALDEGMRSAGEHRAVWNGEDEGGRAAASGTYFLRLETEGGTLTHKMSLVR